MLDPTLQFGGKNRSPATVEIIVFDPSNLANDDSYRFGDVLIPSTIWASSTVDGDVSWDKDLTLGAVESGW